MTLNVSDRLALTDLVHTYAAAIDERRFDGAAELFTETAELKLADPPQFLEPIHVHRGRDAIRSALAKVSSVPRTEHAIVGEVYWDDDDGDTARGRVVCVAHHWSQRGEDYTDLVWHVRYDDAYVRTGVGWRIMLRTLTINAIETRPMRRVR